MFRLVMLSLLGLMVMGLHAEDYDLCMQTAICKNLYGQSAAGDTSASHALGQTISPMRFEREMASRAHKIEALLGGLDSSITQADRIALYEVIIIKGLLDESKCPPNSYWSWSPEEKKHLCRCFLDRDCRASTTTICHDTTHPAMFILLAFACLLLAIDITVRIVTDRYQGR